jgi:hypothetical protein
MKNWKIVLISTLIIGAIIAVLLYLHWASLDFLSVFVKDALWASVLATIVLVVINAFVLLQNRQTIREMEKARKSEFMPHVRVELSWYVPAFLVLKAVNFGKGPATHIKAKITFLPSNIEKNWTEGILSPNESINIFLPDGDINRVCNAATEIIINGDYQDIFEQPYRIAERIHAKEFIDETRQLNPVYDQNEVTKAIKELNERLRSGFDGVRQTQGALTSEIRKINETLDKIARKEESQNSEKY